MKKKKLWILVASTVIIVGVAALFLRNKSQNGYRSIKIYQVSGNALLDRSGIGEINAVENLRLQNQDLLQVLKESNVRLLMDEDKFALVEHDSRISIKAEGNSENSKTNIMLEQGKVTVEIKNKLSSQSTFEVTTPNAVMAVRGTVFHVDVDKDEQGNSITTLTVLEGKVATATMAEDGSRGEEILIEKDGQAVISRDGNKAMITVQKPDYSVLTEKELEFLGEVSENGKKLSISDDAIKKLHEEAVQRREEQNDLDSMDGGLSGVGTDNDDIENEKSNEITWNDNLQTGVEEGLNQVESNQSNGQNKPGNSETDGQNKPENLPEVPDKPENDGLNTDHPVTEKPGKPNSGDSNKPEKPDVGNPDQPNVPGNGKPDVENPNQPNIPGNGNTNCPNSGKPNNPSKPEAEKPSTPEKPDVPEQDDTYRPGPGENQKPDMNQPENVKMCTVTFQFHGQVFATAIVKSGECVTQPKLKPLAKGEWKYDFTKVITKDTVIEFR